jgi:diaminopropionate ammonia-lyase
VKFMDPKSFVAARFQETTVNKRPRANCCLPYPFTLLKNPAARPGEEYRQVTSSPILPQDIQTARTEISSWPGYKPTPLHRLAGLANVAGVSELLYKDESYRFGLGSFKALGGAYAVLRFLQSHVARATGRVPSSAELRAHQYIELTRELTVTAATDGNHGRSVAWGAKLFGCRSVIYVPRHCGKAREDAIERYGAEVKRTTLGYDETVGLCWEDARNQGWTVVSDTSWHGYEDTPAIVMQGYTVMTSEVIERLGDTTIPTHVFVQAGVGGLAGSICAHFQRSWGVRRPRFIVVEPERAACLYASALAGNLTPAQVEVHTIMAGLDCGEPSLLAWRILSVGADFFVTVPDNVAPDCMKLLARPSYGDQPIVAGESAVAGLAAFLCIAGDPATRENLDLTSQSRVLVFGTEGDTAPSIYEEIVGCPGDDIRKRAAEYEGR